MKMPRKVEKWADIVRQLGLDISKPVNPVTAKQIKEITHEEPRLMAKMDTIESLPSIFRENGLFLLPASRTEYLIVKGKGYHKLEDLPTNVLVHETRYLFPSSALGVQSEGIYLDYAYSSGLIGKISGGGNLILAFRGRRTTPRFSFNVSEQVIRVDGAQIEVDGAYESSEEVVLVESKLGIPSSFNIRQLYYPYRTFNDRKHPRNFFFCFEQIRNEYLFWEYDFRPHTSFESIELLRALRCQVKVTNPVTADDYRDVMPARKIIPPQADSVDKIIELPFRISEGYDTSEKMTRAFGFVQRQSSYYRQAAELLGLVESKDDRYALTDSGERYIKLLPEERNNYICRLLLKFPIMNDIFLQLSIKRGSHVTKQKIIEIIRERSQLTGTTLTRRAQTIISWFKWIRNNLGIVEVDRKGNVWISKQLPQSQ